jgi:phthalate 4,5-cis-dihydrodiol dehydrogenase
VASLVYSGYDRVDSAELASGRPPREPEKYGAIQRALRDVRSAEEEVARRVSTGYGGERPVTAGRGDGGSLLQGELGLFVATCGQADLKLAPDGVQLYGREGMRLVKPDPWRGLPGRGAVLDELIHAVTEGRPVAHDGRWARATMEVCLAMLQSARERREITLSQQVPTVDTAAALA